MNDRAQKPAATFELRFKPNVELITVVRMFVDNFYANVIGDKDVSSRVALTTHELLENSAKYSLDGEVRLWVQIDAERARAVVRTTNRAAPEQIERARACFDEITGAQDVRQYYGEMLRRSAQKKSGSGGLGLARIWAESDMSLRLSVNGEEIEIHADGPILAKP